MKYKNNGNPICQTNEEFWQEVSKVWSNKNDKHWSAYTYGSNKYIWVKCNKTNYHDDYKTRCKIFSHGYRCPYCDKKIVNPKDSFAQWGIDNVCLDFLDKYWDYEKNKDINPWEIGFGSERKVYIKCQEKDYHGSYEIIVKSFHSGRRCSYCWHFKVHPFDSFAQYHIDNTDPDFLNKYWSIKNIISPWDLLPNSNKYVYIKCQKKDYHENYKIMCNQFTNGTRCCFCSGSKQVHKLDSFGEKYKNELDDIWDYQLNKYDPYQITPRSHKHIWIKCKIHGSYLTNVSNYSIGYRCPLCSESKGEKEIQKILKINNIINTSQKKFKMLIGLGGRHLSYDFYLPDYNLLIEYQGKQHEKPVDFKGNDKELAQQQFQIRQEHDRRKQEYAQKNNIKLLEIWYYDFNKIEEILKKELNLKE